MECEEFGTQLCTTSEECASYPGYDVTAPTCQPNAWNVGMCMYTAL